MILLDLRPLASGLLVLDHCTMGGRAPDKWPNIETYTGAHLEGGGSSYPQQEEKIGGHILSTEI